MADPFPPSPPNMPVSQTSPSAFPYYGTPPPPYQPPAHGTDPQPPTPGRPDTAKRSPRTLAVIGATVVASLAAGAAGGWYAGSQSAPPATVAGGPTTTAAPAQPTSARFAGDPLDVKTIVAKLGPSVVAINTQVTQRRGPFIQQGQGAGTGVILTKEGEVLTNAHVVAGATQVSVTLNGSDQELPARIVNVDPGHDLALVQITAHADLTPATLGSSASASVGDDVVAIGNALALQGGLSVTRGIVSALNRSIEAGDGLDSETLTGLIQTDAAISSGNSGGALVNADGEVIGINTAVASSGGSTQASNIGFAIPIDTAKQVVEQLRAGG